MTDPVKYIINFIKFYPNIISQIGNTFLFKMKFAIICTKPAGELFAMHIVYKDCPNVGT